MNDLGDGDLRGQARRPGPAGPADAWLRRGPQRFSSFTEMLREAAGRAGLPPDPVSALYASAGADTRPITLISPRHLGARDIDMPAPQLFLYGDRDNPRPGADPGLSFQDRRTRVHTEVMGEVRVGPAPGWILRLRFESAREGWSRTCAVARVRIANEHLAPLLHEEGWVPDVFIGVTDGCGPFGGNRPENCVNRLSTRGVDPARLAAARLPRFWVTDHFQGHRIQGYRGFREPLGPGDLVESLEPGFPHRFRALGVVSREWGTYREHSDAPLLATIAFAVEPAPARGVPRGRRPGSPSLLRPRGAR